MAKLEIVVKKRASIKIKVEEVWVSEKEMRDELGWSTKIGYIMVPVMYQSTHVPRFVFIHGTIFDLPRTRINGAKKACEAKKETHMRSG